MTKIICDKCSSDRVTEFDKEPTKEPEPYTMSEYISQHQLSYPPKTYKPRNDVFPYSQTRVLLCLDCGYRLEFKK